MSTTTETSADEPPSPFLVIRDVPMAGPMGHVGGAMAELILAALKAAGYDVVLRRNGVTTKS